jgi:hypothetical protein
VLEGSVSEGARGDELLVGFIGEAIWIAVLLPFAAQYLFLSKISDSTRSLIKAHFGSPLTLEALQYFSGVPPVWTFLKSNKKVALVLFVLSNFFYGLVLATVFALAALATKLTRNSDQTIVLTIGFVVAFPLLAVVAQLFSNAARSRVQISARELIATDPRKPVLFLRAFVDDQVELPSASLGWLGSILSLGRHRQSFDELLLEEGTLYGPVVALGNPSDKVPPYGAARGYYEHTDWKKAVSDLSRASSEIVVCIDDTESIWWEVEHIFTMGHQGKTLFVLPPKHRFANDDKSVLPRLIKHLPSVPETTLRALLDACSRRDTIAVAIEPSGAVDITSSSTFSGFAYLALLRWYFRSRFSHSTEYAVSEALATATRATSGMGPSTSREAHFPNRLIQRSWIDKLALAKRFEDCIQYARRATQKKNGSSLPLSSQTRRNAYAIAAGIGALLLFGWLAIGQSTVPSPVSTSLPLDAILSGQPSVTSPSNSNTPDLAAKSRAPGDDRLISACLTQSLNASLAVGTPDEHAQDRLTVATCTKAIQALPQEAGPYFARGVAYQSIGRKSDAIADFRKAHALAPWDAMAKQLLDELEKKPSQGRR